MNLTTCTFTSLKIWTYNKIICIFVELDLFWEKDVRGKKNEKILRFNATYLVLLWNTFYKNKYGITDLKKKNLFNDAFLVTNFFTT